MDVQGILAIIFVVLLSAVLYLKRDKLSVQRILYPVIYFVMYRTKLGLVWMDLGAKKFGRSLRLVSVIGIVVGFIGMAFISYELVSNSILLFARPEAAPSIKPVLPFAAKGVFFVPFLYWITSIFVIAVVHEFSHGLVARAYNIPVKSSGFAFLGIIFPIIPAAFVEPDEKKLVQRNVRDQLAVFAAGPFSNIVSAGLLFLLIILVVNPAAQGLLTLTGAKIMTVAKDGPAERAGIHEGELIQAINGVQINAVENFSALVSTSMPGAMITVRTNVTERRVLLGANPKNASKSYIGLSVSQGAELTKEFKQTYGETGAAIIVWFFGLLYWLLLLNLGIGMFNLLPIGPVDGGRMLLTVLEKWSPKKGPVIWKFVTLFFMVLIFANLIIGFVR